VKQREGENDKDKQMARLARRTGKRTEQRGKQWGLEPSGLEKL